MSLYFPTPEEHSRHTIFPGVTITTCAADAMMLSYVEIEPHAVVEEHSHPHEQVGMVIEGKALFRDWRPGKSAPKGRPLPDSGQRQASREGPGRAMQGARYLLADSRGLSVNGRLPPAPAFH